MPSVSLIVKPFQVYWQRTERWRFSFSKQAVIAEGISSGSGWGQRMLVWFGPGLKSIAPLPSIHILSATTRTACPLHRWSPSWSLGKWVMKSRAQSARINQSRQRVWLGSPVFPTSVFIGSGNCVSKSGGKQQSSGGAPVNMLTPKCEK